MEKLADFVLLFDTFLLFVERKKLTFETGELAVQATSSVLARLGDTVVLVTVVEGGKTDLDYFCFVSLFCHQPLRVSAY